jgi:hypothetical protein
MYEENLKYYCRRFSNNKNPEFTDREAITIYLYSMQVEHRFKVKHIYEFEITENMYERTFFGDKIYGDKAFWQEKQKSNQLNMLTPVKGVKGQAEQEKQRDKAYVDLFSAAVSSVF